MRWRVVIAALWLTADTFVAGAANLADGTARMVERLRAYVLEEDSNQLLEDVLPAFTGHRLPNVSFDGVRI